MTWLSDPAVRKATFKFFSAYNFVGTVFAAVIFGLGIWYVGFRGGFSIESVMGMLVYGTVLWGCVASWQTFRAARNLNAAISWEFLSGPRPVDPDELRVWSWSRQFVYAILGAVCCMGIFIAVELFRNR